MTWARSRSGPASRPSPPTRRPRITQTSAALTGQVDPEGFETNYSFQLSTSPSFDGVASLSRHQAGKGSAAVAVSGNLAGLSPATTYYFRLASNNSAGTAFSATRQFTTPPLAPVLTVGEASDVMPNQATLHGAVNPENGETFYLFELTTDPTFATFASLTGTTLGAVGGSIPVSLTAPRTGAVDDLLLPALRDQHR